MRFLLKRAGLLCRYRIPQTKQERNQFIKSYIRSGRHKNDSLKKMAADFRISTEELLQIITR